MVSEIYGSQGSDGIDALIAVARKMLILVDFRSGGSIKYAPHRSQRPDRAHATNL